MNAKKLAWQNPAHCQSEIALAGDKKTPRRRGFSRLEISNHVVVEVYSAAATTGSSASGLASASGLDLAAATASGLASASSAAAAACA